MPVAADITPFEQAINSFYANIVAASKDGLTWAEFGKASVDLLKTAVNSASQLAIQGFAKKELVMQAFTQFLNMVPLPLPWYLQPLAGSLKGWLIKLADGYIESLYESLKAFNSTSALVVNPATTG